VRGFGKSPSPSEAITIKKIADDIAEFVERLNATPTYVVDISMGDTIALKFPLDYPSFVEKLVLVNTFVKLHPEGFSSWAYS